MNKLKIWTASIATGFDSLISKVENHEAVVESSIHDLQKAAAHAKVKLGQLRREIERMQQKRSDLQQKRDRWNKRAIELRDTDKAKAIECLRRKKRLESEIEHIERELPNHRQLAENIDGDVQKFACKIDALKLRKRAYSSRASRAQAMKVCEQTTLQDSEGIETTFDRWELKLAETEIGIESSSDPLESTFEREEETAALEAELELLEASSELPTNQ